MIGDNDRNVEKNGGQNMKKKMWIVTVCLLFMIQIAGCGFQNIKKTKNHLDETKDWKTVHYECVLGGLSLKLPKDWNYSISKYNKKEKTFGIEFWPKDDKKGKINLSYWDMFAVCGTELKQKKIKLDNGMKAWQGTYDNHSYWDFIHFTDEYEHYVVMTECEDEWWQKYKDQVTKILNTIEVKSDRS